MLITTDMAHLRLHSWCTQGLRIAYSYDAESDGPNFSLEHGVQLIDSRFLEYVGAPESARLMSRSPEYWVHHMGVENALSAALQLLVTSMCRTSSDVLLAERLIMNN